MKSAKGIRRYCAYKQMMIQRVVRDDWGYLWRKTYLTARIRPHGHVAIGAASKARINASTECGIALFAIQTPPICYVEGENHSVALLK